MSPLAKFLIAVGIILTALAIPAGLHFDGPTLFYGAPTPAMDAFMTCGLILLAGGTVLYWLSSTAEDEDLALLS